MVQTQHTRQRYTLIASSKTQHGYELSSKHKISTHVNEAKDMFKLESPKDFFNIPWRTKCNIYIGLNTLTSNHAHPK